MSMVICTTSKLENCISLRTARGIRALPAAPLGGSHSKASLRDAAVISRWATGSAAAPFRAPPVSEAGALIELALNGAAPVELATGEKRSFLEDGDTVALRGNCEKRGF